MSSTSSSTSSTTSSSSSPSPSITGTVSVGSNLKVVGIILAVCSGLLIGSSFVLKKKGLLRSQAGAVAGEGVAYLKSPLWWTGMIMMILGELCNFAAYAFVEAIVVTPLGALSVVVCAILSSIFLKETLTFFGWLGCSLCILGSIIIALNGPQEPSVGEIQVFQTMFLSPGFLTWGLSLIAASLFIIFYVGPRWGKQQMIWYILVCSMIGGISVSVTTGLGAAIVQTAFGGFHPRCSRLTVVFQFHYWFLYFLFVFVAVTLVTEVYYLNVALALFNTGFSPSVTPTYYVIFTFFTMITTIVLFKGLQSSASQIITLVMGFLVICVGITILQLSKIDPTNLSSKLDRRSTILLQAIRAQTQSMDEKSLTAVEDPGMDALRGSFGTVGSIIRARSAHRMSQSSRGSKIRVKSTGAYDPTGLSWASDQAQAGSEIQGLPLTDSLSGMKRHQLYDNPVPIDDASSTRSFAMNSTSPRPNDSRLKRPTIKFDSQDVIHQYDRPGTGDNRATHEQRATHSSPGPRSSTFVNPPDSPSSQRTSTATQQEEPQIPKLPPPLALPTEGVLLQLDSPEQSYDFREEAKQLWLNIPSKEQQPPQPRSAPSTFSPRFQQAQAQAVAKLPQRIDSRDVFVDSPGSNTLKTFPSITESGRSEAVWNDEELERQKQQAKARDRARSMGKRYPKTSSVDDAEESQRLFRKQSVGNLIAGVAASEEGAEESEQDTETGIGSPGGIRLVKPRKGPEL
ncbi:hypothetical protein M378DRAFT_88109 [Amanita muscaria Koide BX008]|uniref:DUF803-domain-containing protein n=1 Tax=Amanita muscaria (strain Koide BX008) TaxID=946122 RepID=A0A0C2STC8_AMAMK|nr:hypothetical protein M378DRAFT_88109 [Amanita muscaria Koide BX008]